MRERVSSKPTYANIYLTLRWKRSGFVVAIVLGAIACAGVALGATKPYYWGKDSDSQCGQVPHTSCEITFSGVKGNNGRIKKVTNFVFDGIPDVCTEGTFAF